MYYTAYRDHNAHLHVKSHSTLEFAQDTADQLADAQNIDDFLMPYQAENRKAAEQIAIERLSLDRPVFRDQ